MLLALNSPLTNAGDRTIMVLVGDLTMRAPYGLWTVGVPNVGPGVEIPGLACDEFKTAALLCAGDIGNIASIRNWPVNGVDPDPAIKGE
jgi:hypothetical protein